MYQLTLWNHTSDLHSISKYYKYSYRLTFNLSRELIESVAKPTISDQHLLSRETDAHRTIESILACIGPAVSSVRTVWLKAEPCRMQSQ